MSEDQQKYVKRSTRTWREPSFIERLKIIRDQIALNDQKPTDKMWLIRDNVLRDRESALMVEIEAERTKNATSR